MRHAPRELLAEALGGTNIQAEGAVTANLATIKEAFQQGDLVILRRCDTWQVQAKQARVGRFVVSQSLKFMVDGAAIPVE